MIVKLTAVSFPQSILSGISSRTWVKAPMHSGVTEKNFSGGTEA